MTVSGSGRGLESSAPGQRRGPKPVGHRQAAPACALHLEQFDQTVAADLVTREVVLVHQQRVQPGGRQVVRAGTARRARAHHQHVAGVGQGQGGVRGGFSRRSFGLGHRAAIVGSVLEATGVATEPMTRLPLIVTST